jgi:hypothetical protein
MWISPEELHVPRLPATLRHLGLAWLCALQFACHARQDRHASAVDRLALLADRPDPALGSLRWLAGTWATRDTGGLTLEVWDVPRAGLMLGHGQSLDRDRTTFFESMRIQAVEAGVTLFTSPDAGAQVAFVLERQGPQTVSFANPKHDFPQVVAYSRTGDLLRVHLEGLNEGQRQIVDLGYRCIAGPCLTDRHAP